MGVITVDATAGYAYAAGFRGESAVTIVAGAGPESGYDTTKHNPNRSTGDDSYGLLQINMIDNLGPERRRTFGIKSNSDLFDPATNLRAAWNLSGGGHNWKPWVNTIGKGLHKPYLNAARAAVAAIEARNGGTSNPTIQATVPSVLAGEVLPPGGGLLAIAPVNPIFPALDNSAAATASARQLLELTGVSGHVSLSANSVSQITLVFADPYNTGAWASLLVLTSIRILDLKMIVSAREWGENNGVEIMTVTLRPEGVDTMRQPDRGASWSNMSPTQVMAERARAAGLRFYGKSTMQRTTITRLSADDTGAKKGPLGEKIAESDWEMGDRLAKEEGFWSFESGGAYYFAPPTWLATNSARFPVRRHSSTAERAWEPLGLPTARTTVNEILSVRAIVASLTVPLPRWRGEQVRPGMVCDFSGIPGFDGHGATPLPYIVTDVDFDLDGGTSPVMIQMTEPLDPLPVPNPNDPGGPGQATADGGSTAPGAGLAGTQSTGGHGSYGYQYDATGTTPSGGPQPGATVLMSYLVGRFHPATNNSIYRNSIVSGTNHLSAHAEGRAGDTGVPTSSALGNTVAQHLVNNAPLFGIQCVIWNARIWLSQNRVWRPYASADGKTDDSSLHRNHVHWELCWEAARSLSAAQTAGAVS